MTQKSTKRQFNSDKVDPNNLPELSYSTESVHKISKKIKFDPSNDPITEVRESLEINSTAPEKVNPL